MRNMFCRYLVVFFLLAASIQPARAFLGVGDVVTDPGLTMRTIMAETARAAQTAQMIGNQVSQIQYAVQNTLALGDPVFAPLGNALRSLQSMYMQGQSLMWRAQNLDQQFSMMNPGYSYYLQTMGRGGNTMGTMYQKWSDQANQSTRSALLAAGIQIDDATSTESMLKSLVNQSNTAGGQMQALQAANQIASLQAQQIRDLRLLMAQQNTLHAEYMAQQNARQAADDAFQQQFRGNAPIRSSQKLF